MADLNKLISVPDGINAGLDGAVNSVMLPIMGNPSSNYDQRCRAIANRRLKAREVLRSIGPFRVTGFDLAVASLKEIFADMKTEQRQVYDALSSAGMRCYRRVRGSTTAISNHSWGTAVDFRVNGVLDKRGNDKVQTGLALIAPIFNRHGWYWGAGFPTEDAMHFEVSKQKLLKWHSDGLLDDLKGSAPPKNNLILGDRGSEVVEMQKALNRHGESLVTDGVFGPNTHAAVVAFQSSKGLVPDGVVGPATRTKLGI